MNPRRLEDEAIRDGLLYVAGSLDLSGGGPEIDQQQGLSVTRRSLYFRHARERQVQILQLFDAANPSECYRRLQTIRPQQAFALLNSSLALAQSRILAKRLSQDVPHHDEQPGQDDRHFIEAAFETVLSRRPSQAELSQCQQFLTLQANQLRDPSRLQLLSESDNSVPPSPLPAQRARENLVLVLLNHNDFITLR
jgi:hypothetical protein